MCLALVVGFLVAIKPFPVLAQVSNGTTNSNTHKVSPTDSTPAFNYKIDPLATIVPWRPGDRLEYDVKVGAFSTGNAYMAVIGVDSIRGEPSYHVQMALRGSFLYGAAQINNLYDSWIDTRLITTRRYIRDVHELNYKSYRQYEFYPEKMYWERIDNGESGELATALPLDDIAFIYYVRTLPLEVGHTYTVHRYFKEEGNPVIIKVERKEVRETPVGTFNTIVVRPVIKTKGLFSQGGDAEIHFTDDENRYLVYLRSKIPIVGSITLHLQSITPGDPIHIGASGS